MADTSPGETAYTAFWQRHRRPYHDLPPFAQLPARTRQAWDAAAAAVLQPRVEGQAAQLHQLIDALVAHAAPVLLDKVHLWLSDVTASAHHPCTRRQEGDDHA